MLLYSLGKSYFYLDLYQRPFRRCVSRGAHLGGAFDASVSHALHVSIPATNIVFELSVNVAG